MKGVVQLIWFFLLIPMMTMGQRIDYDSTVISQGQKFSIQLIQQAKYTTLLKIAKGQTVILADTLDFTVDLKLVDFNADDGTDIMIGFMGNVDTQSLYLFDKSKNEFKKVEDFEKYPAAKKVKESDGFYYSYHRSGCADNYWTSDLFKIVDFKVSHVGQIFGNGCEAPRQVMIYKIRKDQKDLVETLPYKLVEESKDNKLGFIANYWMKNQHRFK